MRFYLLIICFVVSVVGLAQRGEDILVGLGFENVALVQQKDSVYASIEDPVYRGTFRGVGVAIKALAEIYNTATCFDVVVKENMIGKVVVHARKGDVWEVDVDYDTNKVERKIASGGAASSKNSSVGKVDLTMYPIVSLDNHLTYRLFSYSIMLAPAFETTLWRGNRIIVQPIIPLLDNYEVGKDDRNIVNRHFQFGSVNVRQDLFDNGRCWAALSAGFFHYNYVGLNADFGMHLNKYFDLRAVLNAVRWQDMNEGTLVVGKKNLFNALVNLSYYEPFSSLELKLTGGRYLYGDLGGRFDCICHFGEYCVGVYGMLAGGEHNAGFNFSVPLAGKRQKRMGQFTVRIPESFDWEYSMVNNFEWADKKYGKELIVDGGKDRAAHYWQARFVEKYVGEFLNGVVD